VAEEAAEAESSLEADVGYFFGYSFGNMLKEGGNEEVDIQLLLKGMRDSLDGKPPELTQAQQEAVINAVKQKRAEIQSQKSQAQMNEGKTFLADNATKEGVSQTASGLQYKVDREGTGKRPVPEDTVVVHYEGRLTNGQVFDSSYSRGSPAEFGLSQVIRGWTEGLQLMKAGGKTTFYIPSDLAYGPGGTGNIPPNSVLIFDVELIEIK